FLALPAERQEQLLKIDQTLHAEKDPRHLRLKRALDRYVSWLDRLPDQERRRIQETTDPAQRLKRIRELREQEWVGRLPKVQRQQVEKARGKERMVLVKKFKAEERQRRIETQPGLQTYIREYLYPKLTREEKERLDNVEGKWPLFAQTLVELADKHPP